MNSAGKESGAGALKNHFLSESCRFWQLELNDFSAGAENDSIIYSAGGFFAFRFLSTQKMEQATGMTFEQESILP